MDSASSAQPFDFFGLPREIAGSILQNCMPTTVAYILATCRLSDPYLRAQDAQTFWSGLLQQHFGPNWLQKVENRIGIDHKTPLWTIYFNLAKDSHVIFRLETPEDPKLDYPFVTDDKDRSKSEGLLRIIVAGELHPGKSSLINAFYHYNDGPAYQEPLHWVYLRPLRPVPLPSWSKLVRGPDCDPSKPIMDMRMGLLIVDIFGGERQFHLPKTLMKAGSGWILCFNITNAQSFEFVETYVEDLLTRFPNNNVGEADYRVAIVGTHLDEADKRQVPVEKAEALAAKINGIYIEVSTITGENASLPFLVLASQCWRSPDLRDSLIHSAREAQKKLKTAGKTTDKTTDKKCSIQ